MSSSRVRDIRTPANATSASTDSSLWHYRYFADASPDPADWNRDDDKDGFNSFLEYALGGEPRIPSVTNFQLQIIDSRLRLVFPRITDPALVYTVEASADLVTWEQPPVYTSTGPANIDGPAIALDRVTLGPGHPRRFLRLLVTRP